ncbi:MAG: right-handed parallel beta-helix repeat-containing protein [Bacteroidota bacterium]
MTRVTLISCLLLIFLNNVALSQVFVKLDAIGNNDGTSWQNAYTNLDTAISRTNTGQIWVASGIYKPSKLVNNLYRSFLLNKPIMLAGGFSGVENNISQRNTVTNITILSGDIGVEGDQSDNTPRVIMITGTGLDSTTCIDGFKIIKAFYSSAPQYDRENGGVYINATGSPVIRNCFISNNSGSNGAGIFIQQGNALINDNNITNNYALLGAGIFINGGNCVIRNNRLQFNTCQGGSSNLSGGAIFMNSGSSYIADNIIEYNKADYGGGIAYKGNSTIKIKHNIISNNSSRKGGAIYFDAPFGNADIIDNLIVHNYALDVGGGIYMYYIGNSNIINNTIAGNSSTVEGAALYLSSANVNITNTIIHNNTSSFGKPIAVYMSRSDWFPKFRYCNIQDSISSINNANAVATDSIWRIGNIASQPSFIDTINYNYRLSPISPCINKGTPDTSMLQLQPNDIEGNQRVVNTIIDMGCYEFNQSAPALPILKAVPDTVNLLYGWRDSTVTVNVVSDIDWVLTSAASWINVNTASGSGNGIASISATANPALSAGRSSFLLLSGRNKNTPSVPITVNQPRAGYVIGRPDTLYINGNENDSTSFTVYSNTFWFVANYPSWLRFSPTGAYYDASAIVKAKENPADTERSGIVIIFSGTTQARDTLIIVQRRGPYRLCAGGSVQLNSEIQGNNYQWQADTGAGFLNISDDSHYAGANTAILQLNNIPSQWYGYKYRCMADSHYSNVVSIKFQNKWTGSVSSAWEDPQNWSCGILPDENTDVLINTGVVSLSSNVTVRSVSLSNNASLLVSPGYNLSVIH